MASRESRTHEHAASSEAGRRELKCGVVTVSDSRSRATDQSGCLVRELLAEAGHRSVVDEIVPDDPEAIHGVLTRWLARGDLDLILTTGGTGIGVRDTTPDVVRPLLTRELEGFGELFRQISFSRIGPAAMLSRATAGLHVDAEGRETFIFVLPGSTDAVRTAMTELIVPQMPHLVWERARQRPR